MAFSWTCQPKRKEAQAAATMLRRRVKPASKGTVSPIFLLLKTRLGCVKVKKATLLIKYSVDVI